VRSDTGHRIGTGFFHVWTAPDAPRSVAVFDHFDKVAVKAIDDRVQDFHNRAPVATVDAVEDHRSGSVVRAIDKAVDWMEAVSPGAWKHPADNEAVFDPPPGYELTHYYIESREEIVYYHREGTHEGQRPTGSTTAVGLEVTTKTDPYFVVKVGRDSGNATVALAPWDYAHETEMVDIRNPPDGYGPNIALTIARNYAAAVIGNDTDPPAVRQANLTAWTQ
jgi:hypothetical protein